MMLKWLRARRARRVMNYGRIIRCYMYENPWCTLGDIVNGTRLPVYFIILYLTEMEKGRRVHGMWEEMPYPRRRRYNISRDLICDHPVRDRAPDQVG